MNILITGGTGFVGGHLCPALARHGHQLTVLTRHPDQARQRLPEGSRCVRRFDEIGSDEVFDAVINLAGEGIADARWSARRKQVLLDSRVGVTQALGDLLARLAQRPQVLISGSAIGFYGDAGNAELTETSPAVRRDFTYLLCDAWEQAAREVAQAWDLRLCILRIGVVMGPGGMLARLRPVYRLGLGAQLGDGQQWMSWIHVDDLVALILRCLDTPAASGVYNAVAPQPLPHGRFHRLLAEKSRRPGFMRVPGWPLKLALGEMSGLLLGGQRVLPRRLQDQGFAFRYPEMSAALDAVLGAADD
ncbi:TIGR01777 family oxidoreductase [Isoalcanivorax indicus]|uniref:TIGR01777 family oxidoreductase n=1 Tax=Isoalcanivorax indicus TaxID=2202653 RepID=UPI000DB9A32C|nr:TIGR01777 family oxidoreductase [Isoalcanivorax indicus]